MPAQIVKKHDKVCRCKTGMDYLQVCAPHSLTQPHMTSPRVRYT